jgi:NitT/TauT family transport system permease protein
VRSAVKSVLVGLFVLGAFWGLWETYKWVWESNGWTHPFVVNDVTMPHLHDIVARLWEPAGGGSDRSLFRVLLDNALFTMKEAAVGFLLGAAIGFALGIVLHHVLVLRRGLLPFIVASQTVPILAVAPMVVIWLGGKGLPVWIPVSVIAAYLTFFPVTINSVRGLSAVDPTSLQLMRSYAAGNWAILWKLRVPTSLPYVFVALKVSATASVVGAIIGELPSSIQEGLGGKILNFNQYYSTGPENLWATNIVAALLGISFFLAIVGLEKLVVHRAPERFA